MTVFCLPLASVMTDATPVSALAAEEMADDDMLEHAASARTPRGAELAAVPGPSDRVLVLLLKVRETLREAEDSESLLA